MTTDGKQQLKTIFHSPVSEKLQIDIRQKNFIFFIDNIENFSRIRLCDPTIYSSRDYLQSNIIPIQNVSRLGVFWSVREYRNLMPHLRKGVASFFELISIMKHLTTIKTSNMSSELKAIFQNLHNFNEKIELLREYIDKPVGKLDDRDILICDHLFRQSIHQLSKSALESLVIIDSYMAIAKTHLEFGLVFPIFEENDSPCINIDNLRHFAINNCIENSLFLDATQKLVYLTGANMSGKSSFLKSVGCAVFLAHSGMGVPATHMNLTPLNGMISDVNNEDNISAGESYFLSEVRRVKMITENVTGNEKMLVICDELFRGTNVIDARDCTHAVVNGFTSCKNALFLIASHIHDLSNEILDNKLIAFFCFECSTKNGTPSFSYKLKRGFSDQRFGIHILKNEGVLDLFQSLTKDVN